MKLGFGEQRTIVLVGMMGVGKTSVGRRLAKRMHFPFSDTDHEVELAAGCTIRDIYEYYGEGAFRDTEKRVIRRLLEQPARIISTGVGTFSDDESRSLIKEKATSVWLYADVQDILPRITRRSHRPQLTEGEEIEETLNRLIKEYYPIYEQADIKVNCMEMDTNAAVEMILTSLDDFYGKQNGL